MSKSHSSTGKNRSIHITRPESPTYTGSTDDTLAATSVYAPDASPDEQSLADLLLN